MVKNKEPNSEHHTSQSQPPGFHLRRALRSGNTVNKFSIILLFSFALSISTIPHFNCQNMVLTCLTARCLKNRLNPTTQQFTT